MAAMNARELKARLDVLKADRSMLDQTFSEVERWVGQNEGGVSPERQGMSDAAEPMERAEVWDFTADEGADKLANAIFSGLTNPASRWAKPQYLRKALQNDSDALTALDDAGEVMFSELRASDFYEEVSALFGDMARYGTGIFVGEPKADALTPDGWKGLDCTAVPPRECYFELDSAGNVFRFFRVLSWTPAKILSKFKRETIPERVLRAAEQPGEATRRFPVVYAIWVREELMGVVKTFPLPVEARPVGAGYFLDDAGDAIGEETGFYEMPVYVVPYRKVSGSDWGKGPGIKCLPTARYLNALMDLVRTAGEKVLDPATMVTERGLLSDLDHRPGAKIVVRDMESMKPFESSARFDVGEHTIADTRATIQQLFQSDDLDLKESPAMTAAEVYARVDRMNKAFAPTTTSIESKFLDLFLTNTFAQLYRAGKLPKLPVQIFPANGDFGFEYLGPLDRAMRIDEVAAIERLASFVAAHVKMGFARAALVYNEEAAVREVAKRLGTPGVVLRSEREVAAAAKQIAEVEARKAQAEAARAEGEAVQQRMDAMASAGAVQPVPAEPTPIISPAAGGGFA